MNIKEHLITNRTIYNLENIKSLAKLGYNHIVSLLPHFILCR